MIPYIVAVNQIDCFKSFTFKSTTHYIFYANSKILRFFYHIHHLFYYFLSL